MSVFGSASVPTYVTHDECDGILETQKSWVVEEATERGVWAVCVFCPTCDRVIQPDELGGGDSYYLVEKPMEREPKSDPDAS